MNDFQKSPILTEGMTSFLAGVYLYAGLEIRRSQGKINRAIK